MPYRIAGIDVHKRMLAVVVTDVEVDGEILFSKKAEGRHADGGEVLAMFFSVQVRDRRHLAHVMRSVKRVADVRKIQRART